MNKPYHTSSTQEEALFYVCRLYGNNWINMLDDLKRRREMPAHVRRREIIDSDIAFIERMLSTRTS